MTGLLKPARITGATAGFKCAVCGIDGSVEGTASAQQAARLLGPGGRILLVAGVDPWDAFANARGDLDRARARLHTDAEEALLRARRELDGERDSDARVIDGRASDILLDEVKREGADLVAVGTHSRGRTHGYVVGSVTTLLLHEAPCSVLVARASAPPLHWPRRILVGVDGSADSALALERARGLGAEPGARIEVITASGGKPLNLRAAQMVGSGLPHKIDSRPPVEALVEASASADLLIVGSRGVHGLSTFGSVSERVADRAACSVLVVRSGSARRESRQGQRLDGGVGRGRPDVPI